VSNTGSRVARSAPRKASQQNKDGADEAAVLLVPVWVKEQRQLLLKPVVVILLVIAYFGQTRGAASGWVLLVTAVCDIRALWWWLGYVRRLDAAQGRWDQALYAGLQMVKVDAMTGQVARNTATLFAEIGHISVRCGRGGLRFLVQLLSDASSSVLLLQ
jgi:hypothetical protein